MAKLVLLVVGVVSAFVLVIVLIGGGSGDPTPPGGGGNAATLYAARCASCHGIDGGGATGPPFSGGRLIELYPDVADQIELVTAGRLAQGMPGFGEVLSDEEIEAVVAYTRSL